MEYKTKVLWQVGFVYHILDICFNVYNIRNIVSILHDILYTYIDIFDISQEICDGVNHPKRMHSASLVIGGVRKRFGK